MRARRLVHAVQKRLFPGATGIVWGGPLFQASGYGNVSRNYLLGLRAVGLPVKAVDLAPNSDDSSLIGSAQLDAIRELGRTDAGARPVEIVHHLPEVFPRIRLSGAATARIGCTIFETDGLPAAWVEPCNSMDEIWVPSAFHRKSFASAGVISEKLRVIPYAVDTEFFHPIVDVFDLPRCRPFRFLYISFWDWRKGFDLLIEAYLKEFTSKDPVSLVLRTSLPHGESSARDIELLLSETMRARVNRPSADRPHVELVSKALGQEDLRRLYNACDLYISTDRANGWGMPCMEAMAMGRPAATIDWSGSTGFMTARNSLLINPTGNLVPVDARLAAERPIYRGQRWAEVTLTEVQRVMRWALDNRSELQRIAARGMADVRERFSLRAVAEQVRIALEPRMGRCPRRPS